MDEKNIITQSETPECLKNIESLKRTTVVAMLQYIKALNEIYRETGKDSKISFLTPIGVISGTFKDIVNDPTPKVTDEGFVPDIGSNIYHLRNNLLSKWEKETDFVLSDRIAFLYLEDVTIKSLTNPTESNFENLILFIDQIIGMSVDTFNLE